MAIDLEVGWYYLHTNGELIWKRFQPESDSTFVKRSWPVDTAKRGDAWTVVLEALALGANIERVAELSRKWRLTLEDSFEMLRRMRPTEDMKDGLVIFIEKILKLSEDEYWKRVNEVLRPVILKGLETTMKGAE